MPAFCSWKLSYLELRLATVMVVPVAAWKAILMISLLKKMCSRWSLSL